MKIAVVGATGKTGRRVLTCALAHGHVVTAVAHHPERLSPDERLTFGGSRHKLHRIRKEPLARNTHVGWCRQYSR